jgi:hypothetical protein
MKLLGWTGMWGIGFLALASCWFWMLRCEPWEVWVGLGLLDIGLLLSLIWVGLDE